MRHLGLPILSLLLWGVLSMAPAAAQPVLVDRIVAVVNDSVIVKSQLDAAVEDARRRLGEDAARMPAELLERRVLEQLVVSELQMQKAEGLGIRVDDQQLNDALLSIARQNEMSVGEFRRVLERDGYDFGQFREKVRREMIVTRLRQREVTNRVTVSDAEVDAALDQQQGLGDSRELRLGHILVALPSEATSEQAQAARRKVEGLLAELRAGADFALTAMRHSDGRNALDGGDIGWRKRAQVPTLFADQIDSLGIGEVSEPIRSPAGYHLVTVLESRGDERRIVTQTHARHILLKADELQGPSQIQVRLEQLRERIAGGDAFEALARAHSQDPVSAARGGDLGWTSPGDLVPQFEQVMERLAPGELSRPFATPFGWHIVQVLERRRHDSTEEFRRSQARESIAKRKGEEMLEQWLRQLRGEAFVEYRLDDIY